MLGYFDYMLGFEWLCSESYYKFKEIENYNETAHWDLYLGERKFFPLIYGVAQGLLALRKAVTIHVKKYDIFSRVFDIANQLQTRHSPFAPLGQVDEKQSSWRQSLHLFFFRTMAVKTLKNPYHLQTEAKTFLERGRKLICEKKNRKLRI